MTAGVEYVGLRARALLFFSHRLIQRVQHAAQDGCACGNSYLRVGTHAVCGQLLRRETRR